MKKIVMILLLSISISLTGCEKEKEKVNCMEEDINDVQQMMYCENESYIDDPHIILDFPDFLFNIYMARNYEDEIVYYYEFTNYTEYEKNIVLYRSDDGDIPSYGDSTLEVLRLKFEYVTEYNYQENIDYENDVQFGDLDYGDMENDDIYIGWRVDYLNYYFDANRNVTTVSGFNGFDVTNNHFKTNVTVKEYTNLKNASEK